MDTVHVFISTGRFRSFEEMRAFLDPTYTEDGDMVPSPFMVEVGLTDYEPACIEAVHSEQFVLLPQLLANVSYSDQWVGNLQHSRRADAAICVFSPNRVARPQDCSLEYCGTFQYRAAMREDG
jgi:hypothetical protein